MHKTTIAAAGTPAAIPIIAAVPRPEESLLFDVTSIKGVAVDEAKFPDFVLEVAVFEVRVLRVVSRVDIEGVSEMPEVVVWEEITLEMREETVDEISIEEASVEDISVIIETSVLDSKDQD